MNGPFCLTGAVQKRDRRPAFLVGDLGTPMALGKLLEYQGGGSPDHEPPLFIGRIYSTATLTFSLMVIPAGQQADL